MVKPLTLKTLDRKAAKLCKLRAGGRCERCITSIGEGQSVAEGYNCECSHFISKGESPYLLRWDESNLDWLCIAHHRYFETHPEDYEAWRMDHRPMATTRVLLNRNARIPTTKALWMEQENGRLDRALKEFE